MVDQRSPTQYNLQGIMPSLDIVDMISSTRLMLKNQAILLQKKMQREKKN